MDRLRFAQSLREAVVRAVRDFCDDNPGETPYAFALIQGQVGNYLGFAIATEEGLRRVAAKYDALGYRYQGFPWEVRNNVDELVTWLRWANPDDEWRYGDFSPTFQITESLASLVGDGAFGENAAELEEFCSEVLASLQKDVTWDGLQISRPIVVGVTDGVDPRDFLRTATRCNRYPLVCRLWTEYAAAEELSSRISSPE
jgi:hypothetical protein